MKNQIATLKSQTIAAPVYTPEQQALFEERQTRQIAAFINQKIAGNITADTVEHKDWLITMISQGDLRLSQRVVHTVRKGKDLYSIPVYVSRVYNEDGKTLKQIGWFNVANSVSGEDVIKAKASGILQFAGAIVPETEESVV
jgi:hypothetical protein